MSTFRILIKKDKRFLRLKKAFDELPQFNLPLEELLTEIESLNRLRLVRSLSSSSPDFVDKVIRASLNDQSVRSRLTEILSECLKASRALESAIDIFTDYALAHYEESLKSIRTKQERQTAVRSSLSDFRRYLDKVEHVRDAARLLIEDIDKSSWTLKLTIEALKLIHSPERSL